MSNEAITNEHRRIMEAMIADIDNAIRLAVLNKSPKETIDDLLDERLRIMKVRDY